MPTESLIYDFTPANFAAHGEHFLVTPILFWIFVIANLLIFISYVLIPIVLLYFVQKRKDLVFNWVFVLFGLFIVACGVHHLLHLITFWYPIYGIEAANDVITAIVSFGTFLALIPVLPLALKLPSPSDLAVANEQLSKEIETRKRTESQLKENQSALAETNAALRNTNSQLQKVNDLMVGRELRIVELKEKLKKYEP